MKRRSKTGSEAIKEGRRRSPQPKRRNAPKVPARSISPPTQEETEVARLTRELNEAREQQTATAEVLQVIRSFAGELEPVFQAILANATRICEAKFADLLFYDGGPFRIASLHGAPRAWAALRRREPILRPPKDDPLSRLAATKQLQQVADMRTEKSYIERDGPIVALVETAGARTIVMVPMLKDDELIGAIAIYRQEVQPFTDEQVNLLLNFAAQAVIAIENARLINELRQRTTDLGEALEQQQATSDLLQVISGSPGNLQPVFQAMLENAVRICGAHFGNMFLCENDMFRTVAMYNAPETYVHARTGAPFRPLADSGLGRLAATKEIVQIADLRTEERYTNRDPFVVAGVELGGIRTLLAVPMLKDDNPIGGIVIYRQEVRPFSEKQIELVRNFASQVVIATENARLLNELRHSLERQTATSQVLQVISSSPGDLDPVFRTMLENATRICDAHFGVLHLSEGDAFRTVALHNASPDYVEAKKRDPMIRDFPPTSALTRLRETRLPVQIADIRQEEAYSDEHTDNTSRMAFTHLTGVRTLLAIPMVDNEVLMGAIMVYRQEVRSFTDEQIELMQNFAAQAVIAIENARLLRELRERTEQVEAQSKELTKLNQQLEHRVADQVGEIERMGRLRRFLPPQVADLIVASGTEKQLESHRREITALFCDLRGFTGFTESADAEDVMALLRDYHAAIGETIIKYSGTLERYAGDGVMVIFNDPVPVENPALQAVLMALEMRNAIGALTDKWRRLGHDIGYGIGIAHGFATLGTIGFEGRFDYAAIGTVSNVASRLCDEAKPGQILISPRVLMAVEDAVTVEPVGEFALKGIRRPLAAYNVLAAGSTDGVNS